jgi:SAM-dependent methyltransferase
MRRLQLLFDRFEKRMFRNIRQGVINSWLHPGKLERQSIIDFLNAYKHLAKGRLLDIGCGSKPYVPIFNGMVDQYLGIDLPPMVSSFIVDHADCYASVLDLPFRAGTIDTVLTTQVLEHVPEPDMVFSEVYRVLKKNGVMIATAPQTWGLHGEPADYYRFTKYGLSYLAQKNGLKVEAIAARGGFFVMVGQLRSSLVFKALCVRRDGRRRSIALIAMVCVICSIIQMLAFVFDRLAPDHTNTLGYGMVARKCE